jgi:hypothetical protein
VIQMTQSGNGVDVLTAPAGAGKTFAFAAARDAWERSGYRVIGAAHTGVAADELSMAAGIPSTTIARLLIAIDRGEPGGLDDRTVLVIDEAGTAGTRDLARLLDEVQRTGAKAVLVGDPKQLPGDRCRRTVRRSHGATTGARATRQPSPAARVGDRSAAPAPRRQHHPRAPRLPPTTIASPSATTPTTPRPSCSGTGGRDRARRRRRHARRPPRRRRRAEHLRPRPRRGRRLPRWSDPRGRRRPDAGR